MINDDTNDDDDDDDDGNNNDDFILTSTPDTPPDYPGLQQFSPPPIPILSLSSNAFKVRLSHLKKICIICFIETPFKMIKMLFISS